MIPRQEYDAETSFAAALIVGFLDNPSEDGDLLWLSLDRWGFQVPHTTIQRNGQRVLSFRCPCGKVRTLGQRFNHAQITFDNL